jgi:hypothetical protein
MHDPLSVLAAEVRLSHDLSSPKYAFATIGERTCEWNPYLGEPEVREVVDL